jgi:hypothetical protein
MNALEAASRIARSFDDAGIAYAIGGALALGVWGAPRATKDVDITAFVPPAELARVIDALERAGVIVDRAAAARDVARIGLFRGRLGRIIIDVADLESMIAARATFDFAYVRSWLTRMVPAGDRRLATLDDLQRRFGPTVAG